MVQYAETQKALESGFEGVTPEKGVQLIEKWEETLKDFGSKGSKGILRDLGALKKALQADEPDAEKIQTLLGKLGQETTEIAEEAEGASQDKLRDLGKGLQQAAN